MRYYVLCKDHPDEKIYVRLTDEPKTRDAIPFEWFTMSCTSSGVQHTYLTDEIVAEKGTALPLAGGLLGAVLYLVSPVAGIVGALVGAAKGTRTEEDRVRQFNSS